MFAEEKSGKQEFFSFPLFVFDVDVVMGCRVDWGIASLAKECSKNFESFKKL